MIYPLFWFWDSREKVHFFPYPPSLTGGFKIHKGLKKLKNQDISKTNLLLVDWLTFSTVNWSEAEILSMLQLQDIPWEERDGFRYGYRHLKTYGGMTILSDGHQENVGICFEFSGQGCRSFESFSSLGWMSLFQILIDEYSEFRISRIDLAFDDHTGILDLEQLLDDTDQHRYRSRSRWWKVEYGSTGTTIYHGSPQSKIRVRIYDKALERGLTDGTHWVRVELLLRDYNAVGAIQSILEKGELGKTFSGILSNYLVYCEESDDSNRSRWPVADYWEHLIQGAEAIHIAARPGVEYNVFRLLSYLRDQCGGAIYTWLQLEGLDSLEELVKERRSKLNPKHKALLDQAGKEVNSET